MLERLFAGLYSRHYQGFPRRAYLIPLLLITLFAAIVGFLCFVRTDKVVSTSGTIMPSTSYVSRLSQRGFVIENRIAIGRAFRRGEMLASVQLDDGSLQTFNARHDGVVVDSVLKNTIDGPLEEGALLATLVDPRELQLRVELEPSLRGTIRSGTRARYKFDTFTRALATQVLDHDIHLRNDGPVSYAVLARLHPQHQRLDYLGKTLPVKLLVEDISLLDYFLNY